MVSVSHDFCILLLPQFLCIICCIVIFLMDYIVQQLYCHVSNRFPPPPKAVICLLHSFVGNSVKGMPYEERLRKLKLPTMTYRRARGLMMEVWKHINSYDTAVISPTFQFTRSAWYPFQLKRFNSRGSQSKSFYHLAPTLWNDLPWQLERKIVEIHLKID